MSDESALWLGHARSDLDTAAFNARGGRFAAAAFFAQQAAEKELKAVYVARRGELWRVHDLVAIAAARQAPVAVVDSCERLTPHYIATRYPVGPIKAYDEIVMSAAIRDAEEVVRWATSHL